jgi:hypothetical protein
MRDLTKRGMIAAPPKGLAFEIADLVLVGSWADCNNFRIVVRLDHGDGAGEEYEEVIAFQTEISPLYRLIMWRNAEAVFVQPLVGRMVRYGSVVEALDGLLPTPRFRLTDITATTWPTVAARPGVLGPSTG